MRNTQKLLKLCNQRNALIVPGAPNAVFARIIEDLGFEAIYVTGAGIANMQLGMPDLGLTTVSEISNTVANVADVVDLPIIVDADTGFGNALNVIRTIKTLERSGASGVQLEDQVFPSHPFLNFLIAKAHQLLSLLLQEVFEFHEKHSQYILFGH